MLKSIEDSKSLCYIGSRGHWLFLGHSAWDIWAMSSIEGYDMCGIAGKVNFNNKIAQAHELELMHQALSHRGPDSCGVYVDENIGLGHSRLSIIDLTTAAHQPMPNEDKSVWTVFNGEIYNYRELKVSLLRKGHRFLSNSDTEVLVHLYEEDGIDFIHKLNGMFAFCIYDKKKKRLFLVRDRIGIKPLYYYIDNRVFLFASEIKALLTYVDINRTMDFTALSEYLTLGYIPAPRSIFEKIKKIKPAEYLELDLKTGNFKKTSYWDFIAQDNGNEKEACEKLLALLKKSVGMRLISDVPLGAFLSGGIDSSTVVAFMSKMSTKRPKTFTIGFSDEPRFDETFYAKKVSEMYDTDHTEIKIKYENIIDDLPYILDSFDEPFADSSALPTFIISKVMRGHVKVALSGDGGDELFGGYNKYIGMMLQRRSLILPCFAGPILRAVFKKSFETFDNKLFGKFKRRMRRMINGLGSGGVGSHIAWITQFTQNEKSNLTSYGLENALGEKEIAETIGAHYGKIETDWVNKALYTDLKLQLADDMLTKVDRMSMLTSLEVRVPFLDHLFASEMFGLAGNLKIRNGKQKYVLLKAVKGLLPKELHRRPKKGFEVPIGPWFRKNRKLQELFMDCMKNEAKGCIVNTDNAIRLFNLHKEGPLDYSRELWTLLVLKWWNNKYL